MSEASTSYKKQDGKLSVAKDGKTVSWKPAASTPPLTIAVSEITSTTLLTSTGQPEWAS
jgi:transcription initiation factor TFIIH subunit 1